MRRKADPLIEDLIRWGSAHANRYAYTRADRSVHSLEQARDLAPGTKENALRALRGRDGGERRRFMADRSGVVGMGILPTWAVDPVPPRNDADRPHDNPEIAVDMGIPTELRWIDRALSSMERQYLLRALIVRTEFTVSASQAQKARMACRAWEEAMAKILGVEPPAEDEEAPAVLTVWQYRDELRKGIAWIDGRRESVAA